MNATLEFLSTNTALLISVIALIISLRASHTALQAHKLNLKSKADLDRVLLFEKKRELLNAADLQHCLIAKLMTLIAQKILLFREKSDFHKSMPGEFDRLKSNLTSIQYLYSNYEVQRCEIEAINAGDDIATLDEKLANIRRLSIHIEKDIALEQAHFDKTLVNV